LGYAVDEVINMKRKLFSLVLCLAALCIGGCTGKDSNLQQSTASIHADAVPASSRLQAPAHIKEEFSSESGISRVIVDADIVLPDTDQFSLIEALPRVYTEQEMQAFYNRHSENLVWTHATKNETWDGNFFTKAPIVGESFNDYTFWIKVDPQQVGIDDYRSINASYGLSRKGKIAFPPRMEYIRSTVELTADDLLPLTNGKAADCTISLEEAMTIANNEVKNLAPDYCLSAYGQIPTYDDRDNPQYYGFAYTQNLKDVPVNYCYGMESVASDYSYISGQSVIRVVIADDGVRYLEYNTPMDAGETLENNVALLPFEDIWDIFEKIGLLSIQHLEAYPNLHKNHLEIYEIRLGYMAVYQGDGSYIYTPVWDFYGHRRMAGVEEYAHAHETNDILHQSHLTINAITGTVIKRTLGY